MYTSYMYGRYIGKLSTPWNAQAATLHTIFSQWQKKDIGGRGTVMQGDHEKQDKQR